MRKGVVLALAMSMCAAAPSTQAQGLYVGLEVGQSHSDVGMGDGFVAQRGTLTGTARDERDDAYGAHIGYAITKHFSFELAYSNLGESR